jgi:hypothetical protein
VSDISIETLKKRLQAGEELIKYNSDELNYVTKPIGKAIYEGAQYEKHEKPKRKKWNPAERVTCELCGKEYSRSARSQHSKTQVHLAYKVVNDKLKELMLK